MRSPGHTLLELLLVLALTAWGGALFLPAARRWHDLQRLTAAREAVVGAIAAGRQAARRTGEAEVEFLPDSGLVRVWSRGRSITVVEMAEFRTRLGVPGARPSWGFRFDGRGLARGASRTVEFVDLHDARRRVLVISALGRVRRR